MARTFDPKAIIVLPRLTAISAAVLMRMLLTVANSVKKLPASIAGDCAELTSAYDALQTALRIKLAPEAGDPAEARKADIAEDNAWSALYHFLFGWSKIPAEKYAPAAGAQIMLVEIFPDGLKFTQLRFKLEWQAAETRLALIDDDEKKFSLKIKKLGGEPLLSHLREAHQQYGEVLGITAIPANPANPLTVREAFDAAQESLRTYTLRVSAYHRKSDPSTVELVATLLEPLASWEDDAAPQATSGEEQGNAGEDATNPSEGGADQDDEDGGKSTP